MHNRNLFPRVSNVIGIVDRQSAFRLAWMHAIPIKMLYHTCDARVLVHLMLFCVRELNAVVYRRYDIVIVYL